MFLGTSRLRWIMAGVVIVAGMALFIVQPWGVASSVAGILVMMLGMATFVYTPVKKSAAPAKEPEPAPAVAPPPRPAGPRPEFEARDRDAI